MKRGEVKQAEARLWLGALQVQLSNSMSFYLTYWNIALMAMMFWYTTAAPNIRPIVPWASFWMFAAIALLGVAIVMLLDFKFIYPSRQAFLNKQSYKHRNPAVADLQKILKDLKAIKQKLGMEE